MRGSVKGQVEALWRHSGIDEIGHSKHQDKAAARAAGAVSSSEIGQQTGIHTFAAGDSYRPVWAGILKHAREAYGVKDAEQITGEHVRSYLTERAEVGIAWNTLAKEAAAANKLAVALNRWSEKVRGADAVRYSFAGDVKAVRSEFRDVLDRTTDNRAYSDPRALVGALERPEHQLVAALQLDGKLRINEASQIKASQLLGERRDPYTGQMVGILHHVDAKGAKEADVPVRLDTYRALVNAVAAAGGTFRLGGDGAGRGHDEYRQALKAAAAATGQPYTGSHGLRYNGCQERHAELVAAGATFEAALQFCSGEMTHERIGITRLYLGE
jgi:hypothetical protein